MAPIVIETTAPPSNSNAQASSSAQKPLLSAAAKSVLRAEPGISNVQLSERIGGYLSKTCIARIRRALKAEGIAMPERRGGGSRKASAPVLPPKPKKADVCASRVSPGTKQCASDGCELDREPGKSTCVLHHSLDRPKFKIVDLEARARRDRERAALLATVTVVRIPAPVVDDAPISAAARAVLERRWAADRREREARRRLVKEQHAIARKNADDDRIFLAREAARADRQANKNEQKTPGKAYNEQVGTVAAMNQVPLKEGVR